MGLSFHERRARRSLAFAAKIVEKPRADLTVFEDAKKTLARWRTTVDKRSQPYLMAWEEVFDQGLEATISQLLANGHWADDMRKCSPFAGALANDERMSIIQDHPLQ